MSVFARMDDRTAELETRFEACVAAYCASQRFGGPSWYFHQKTIERRRQHRCLSTLLDDGLFFDHLYATLTAWGLHRMGPGNTKLRELSELRESVAMHAAALDELSSVVITDLPEGEVEVVTGKIWSIMLGLRVSRANARIVATTKTLHHLLPDLVPPIDRQYTFRFFFGGKALSVDEPRAFREMFQRFARVARARRETIDALVGTGWNTSRSKVLDNAVMGYVIGVLRPSARERMEQRRDEHAAERKRAAAPVRHALDQSNHRRPATCRGEILAAADAIVKRSGRSQFSIAEVMAEMRARVTRYRENTIRTHMSHHMCQPGADGVADLRRVGWGVYERAGERT